MNSGRGVMLKKILARLYFVCGAFCLIVAIVGFTEGSFISGLFVAVFLLGGWAVLGWVLSPYLFKKDSQD
jgi:hypothetical protein